MNTNKLKTFAQKTRKKLLQQVEERLDYVLNTDSAELREQKAQVEALKKEVKRTGRKALIDKVAYTWFNRLVALRYMDVNDYQPFHVRVISPQDGFTEPQILSDAKQGIIPDEFKVDRTKINQLLDGTLDSQNPQNEVFKLLLVAACNHLHSIFPFLFEPIADYSELLLPADLISEHSVIHEVVEGMTAEECQQVEILGWLYQFYISEKKDEVFASKGKVKKEEIPAATQLFTPRWIVEYMVQNTVGKLWVLNHPNSRLKEHMEYYIESEITAEDVLTIDIPEELTLLDQACGSGHILVYGFELLYKIYEEEGYAPSDIPRLIIEHNLHGFEIDERAAQLAGLAILMKAREYQRRLFRKSDVPEPNITCFEDLTPSNEEIKATLKSAGVDRSDELLHDLQNMHQATNFGSLIVPHTSVHEIRQAKTACEQAMDTADLFEKENLELLIIALETLEKLGTKVSCVVDNPPYMGSSKMNKQLSDFVKTNFPDSKADLLTCFMERARIQLQENGFLSMINLPSWMFLSSFEKFRKNLLEDYQIESFLHLGRGIFGSDFGTVAFSFRKTLNKKKEGVYRRLFEKHVQVRSVDKIEQLFHKKHYGYFNANQNDFKKIPGSPIGYWLSENFITAFINNKAINKYSIPKFGMSSGDGQRFIRYNYEVEKDAILKNADSLEDFKGSKVWGPLDKGGEYRKWYGNQYYVVNWAHNGDEIRSHPKSAVRSPQYFLKPHHSWTLVSSGAFSARFFPDGYLLDTASNCVYLQENSPKYTILGYLNTKLANEFLKVLNPTLNYSCGVIGLLPFSTINTDHIDNLVNQAISVAKKDWNSRENSIDFQQNELIRFNKEGGIETLEEAYDLYKQYWQNKFYQLHQNEEELNRQFINIYGLQEELTPEVPLDEITILQEELDAKKLKKLEKEWRGNSKSQIPNSKATKPALPFKDKEVMAQFISYAVGCLFGRYSLDKEGLILANQGETLEDYLRIVSGEWWFVNSEGKWEIDKTKDAYEHYKQLQRSENLERRNETDQRNLSDDGTNAEAGNVRPDESDKESGSEHSEQHRGGTNEGNQGVHSLFKDSERITGRTGYAAEPDNRTENAEEEAGSDYPGRSGNSGETNQQSHQQTQLNNQSPTDQPPITFLPDEDNIIPVLEDNWFEDDITGLFYKFLRSSFGEQNFEKNLAFIEEKLGHNIRTWFTRYFYNDHVKRYNKRPIYWQFSSENGVFKALIYMHRYTPDTLNKMLNGYLRDFKSKLNYRKSHLEEVITTSQDSGEVNKAEKELRKTETMLEELETYEREVLMPLATDRIQIDLDDGVLVNYNKFGQAVEEVNSLNDKKKKKAVKEFDWIDGSEIR